MHLAASKVLPMFSSLRIWRQNPGGDVNHSICCSQLRNTVKAHRKMSKTNLWSSQFHKFLKAAKWQPIFAGLRRFASEGIQAHRKQAVLDSSPPLHPHRISLRGSKHQWEARTFPNFPISSLPYFFHLQYFYATFLLAGHFISKNLDHFSASPHLISFSITHALRPHREFPAGQILGPNWPVCLFSIFHPALQFFQDLLFTHSWLGYLVCVQWRQTWRQLRTILASMPSRGMKSLVARSRLLSLSWGVQ